MRRWRKLHARARSRRQRALKVVGRRGVRCARKVNISTFAHIGSGGAPMRGMCARAAGMRARTKIALVTDMPRRGNVPRAPFRCNVNNTCKFLHRKASQILGRKVYQILDRPCVTQCARYKYKNTIEVRSAWRRFREQINARRIQRCG